MQPAAAAQVPAIVQASVVALVAAVVETAAAALGARWWRAPCEHNDEAVALCV